MSKIQTTSPKPLYDLVQAGQAVELIDVRTPIEFREVHVPFARNVPLDQLQPAQLAEELNNTGRTLYVVCRSGGRGRQACEKLLAAGAVNVVNVEGGTQGWEQAGLPVVRGRKAVSLERQVRIAAGSLVLAGTLLGAFVSEYWLGLAGFVGAGLVFAGVTDTCGMGMMLARMPWNQIASPPAATPVKSCSTGSGAACSG
ncbi:MAG TPA: rhodanese-like domain-containing protein [Pirellulales bacterium]